MRARQKAHSIFLSVLMLICCLSMLTVVSFAADYQTGDVIELGNYPQTLISDETLIAELDAESAEATWQPMGYTSDSANEAYFYKDVVLGENEYRAIRFTSIHSRAQSRYGYETNTVYWFFYEPIDWVVLDPASGLVSAASILDVQPINNSVFNTQFSDADNLYYLNNYAHGSIHTWMNELFLDSAFSEEESSILILHEQDNSLPDMDEVYSRYACENSSDLVFLLSYYEVANEEYFPDDTSRVRGGTDYARALGLDNYSSQNPEGSPENDFWFLRSPGHTSTTQGYIGLTGTISSGIDSYSFDVGMCPAMYIDLDAYGRLSAPDEPDPSIYDNLSFSFEDGILIVSGSGEIPTADESDPAPFLAYADECRVIVINEGIEAVQADAFVGLDNIELLVLNGNIRLEDGAFSVNDAISKVICKKTVQTALDAFFAETDILFYEPKETPHTGVLSGNVNVIPYSFADGTLTFDGRVSMDTYGLLDLMAVMCNYYEPIHYISFTSYTSLDVPFYVFKVDSFVPADNNTLEGVRFSVKISGDKDWETITFNTFCARADAHDVDRFRLVADLETGEEVQDHDYEIKEEQPIVVIIKRVLKWITTLLNKLFSIFSKMT